MWAAAANVEAVVIPSPAGPDRKQRSTAANQRPLVVQPIDQRRDLPYITLMLEAFGKPHPSACAFVAYAAAFASPVFAENLQALTFPRSAGASDPECSEHNIKGMWQN